MWWNFCGDWLRLTAEDVTRLSGKQSLLEEFQSLLLAGLSHSAVIVPIERSDDWLQASAGESGNFLREWHAELMSAKALQQNLSL